MNVLVVGSSGFVGQFLVPALEVLGHEVSTLNRPEWDGKSLGPWQSKIEAAEAVVNLSGSPVSVKWTLENQRLIRDSRVDSTRALSKAIWTAKSPPKVWVNASAVGYYGDTGDRPVDETSPAGKGFLPETCQAWEAEATARPETRVVIFRFGVVLGRGGGALAPLAKLTRAFAGSAVGSGKQWVPWIHLQDLARLIDWTLMNPVSGPINVCSPRSATNGELMATLRECLHRPWVPNVPAWLMTAIGKTAGPDAEIVLNSMHVLPRKAEAAGFEWKHPDLREALEDLLS